MTSVDPRRTQPFCTPRCYRECRCSRWPDYVNRFGEYVVPHPSEAVECWHVEFNGTTTDINCGSDASLDNLHAGELSVEAWIRADGWGENNLGRIVDKGTASAVGWTLQLWNLHGLRFLVMCDTDGDGRSGTDEFTADGLWHHVVGVYSAAGDRKPYLAIDGVWVTSYSAQIAAAGAIDNDAAQALRIGNALGLNFTFDGGIGWVRISDTALRYTPGVNFTPPDRCEPPVVDANTTEIWHLDEGAGGTTYAHVTSPANDGTITNGSWQYE